MKAQFSALYKANRARMNQEERKEFVRELQKVIDNCTLREGQYDYRVAWDTRPFFKADTRLTYAFIWTRSPQGHAYWYEICRVLRLQGE